MFQILSIRLSRRPCVNVGASRGGKLALPFHAMITYTGLVTLMVLYVPWGVAANYPSKTAYYAQSITRAKPVKP